MYRVLTIVNTVAVIVLVVFALQDSMVAGEQFAGLKAENIKAKVQNQELQAELVDLRDEISKLHFELAKAPAQVYFRPSQKPRQTPEGSALNEGGANPLPGYRPEDFDVWAGVDDVVPHANDPAQYDSVNTEIDREALSKRECYAEGKGVIGMFAAITAKCPDWYLGDGIIIID